MNAPASSSGLVLSVILCTHNPAHDRIQRTLTALRAQILPVERWETLLIDNASSPSLAPSDFADFAPANCRFLREPELGLTAARRNGLRAARGDIIVFVDDDNVLAPDYLTETLAAFARLPRVGALGGRLLPEFSSPLAADDWRHEFLPLLALRDLGERELISTGLRPPGSTRNVYPDFAPIGAGLALRRTATVQWLEQNATALSDRRGAELSSSGDNDIVFSVLRAGWEVAYLPALTLTHLIPASRLTPDYLARLNHGIQKSWTRLLLLHDASPWPSISATSARMRKLKTWLTHRVWTGRPANRIRWRGACGHFDGRVLPPHA